MALDYKIASLKTLIVLIIHVGWFLSPSGSTHLRRNKRTLIYPGPVAKVQAIMGAGFPVDLRDETVIVGIVIKSIHLLPRNSSFYTNPNVIYARKRRSLQVTPSRWDLYKLLESYSEMHGYGGKGCVLRTICELAHMPIQKNTGIVEEIIHAIFTPSTTNEEVLYYPDYDYLGAQKIGTIDGESCSERFRDCKASFADMFSTFLR